MNFLKMLLSQEANAFSHAQCMRFFVTGRMFSQPHNYPPSAAIYTGWITLDTVCSKRIVQNTGKYVLNESCVKL